MFNIVGPADGAHYWVYFIKIIVRFGYVRRCIKLKKKKGWTTCVHTHTRTRVLGHWTVTQLYESQQIYKKHLALKLPSQFIFVQTFYSHARALLAYSHWVTRDFRKRCLTRFCIHIYMYIIFKQFSEITITCNCTNYWNNFVPTTILYIRSDIRCVQRKKKYAATSCVIRILFGSYV